MQLTFLGAAGEVTGSCTRVDHGHGSFLVDCGMFQGGREADAKNFRAFDFDLHAIDFVLLTHAHLDHSGLIPRLVALGYRGPIYATEATVELLGVMLLDSGFIQEKEAEWANRQERARRSRRGWSAVPLYTVEQARTSLGRLRPVAYDDTVHPGAGIRCRFRDAGHILGSAIIEIDLDAGGAERRLVFSGDLGQPMRPVLRDPTRIARADVLCIESTYGNRLHRPIDETCDELVTILNDTLLRRRGNVIIPAFAVGRTQEMLFLLAELVRDRRVERLEVVVDSPMAAAVTELTARFEALWDEETRELYRWFMAGTDRFRLRLVADVEESMALNEQREGLVIISASGMCDAGRIKHHLRHNIDRPQNAIVIVGFQAAGTLGRRLVDGARHVTLFGTRLPVRASIHTIGGLSAHADQAALIEWMRHIQPPPQHTFVMHGEAETAASFVNTVTERLGWRSVKVAATGQPWRLA